MAAYRTYIAAREKSDLKAAEAAATQALAASEARDGGGGSTAPLAFNLALVRMDLDQTKDAVAPAKRAVELAAGGARGVDLLAARLMLGEAELKTDPKASEAGLAKALQEAEARSDLDEFAYPASMALAKAALATRTKENLVIAWRAAATHAAGAHGDLNLTRGRALTEEAISLMSERKFKEASDTAYEAVSVLVKVAPEDADWEPTKVGESYYADALALRAALGAFYERPSRKGGADDNDPVGRPGQAAFCGGPVTPHPLPDFPTRPLRNGEIGAVVVRIRTDAAGVVTGVRTISTLIDPDFRKAVESPHIRWVYEPRKRPGCRLATNDRLEVINFRIGY